MLFILCFVFSCLSVYIHLLSPSRSHLSISHCLPHHFVSVYHRLLLFRLSVYRLSVHYHSIISFISQSIVTQSHPYVLSLLSVHHYSLSSFCLTTFSLLMSISHFFSSLSPLSLSSLGPPSIPHCMSTLNLLSLILLSVRPSLTLLPLSIFCLLHLSSFPLLSLFSLFPYLSIPYLSSVY